VKKVRNLFIALFILVAAFGLLVFLYLGSATKRVIETAGTSALGTKVSVSGLDISLRDKKATMRGLAVANLPGFDADKIVQAKTISATVGDISQHLVTLDEIVVDGMTVNYELGTGGTNFDVLRKNMASTKRAGDDDAENSAASRAPKVVIHKLKILNAVVVPSAGKNKAPISLPDLTLTEIGSKSNPATARDVARQVLNKVLSASSTAIVTSGIAGSINKSVDKAAEKIKGLFGK
jgi:hypothetical protein